METKQSRVLYFDVLNVVSCLSVVALHCNGYVHSHDTAEQWWWLRVFVEVFFYNAVPIFFMLSGANLLGYHRKYDTLTFFKKRFKKAVLPFLAFSVIFYTIYLCFHPKADGSLPAILYSVATLHIPLSSFWFFLPLFLLYAFMPFLSVMVANLSNKQILCLTVLMVVLQSVVMQAVSVVGARWDLPIGGYVSYLLLGYYLSRTNHEDDNRLLATIAAAAILSMAARYCLIFTHGVSSKFLFTYYGLFAFLPSAAMFLVAKRLFKRKINLSGGVNRFVLFLSRRSFGVYLIQSFVISCFARVIPMKSAVIVFLFPVVYLVCVAIVYLMQKTRLTRWMVP